MGFVIIWKIILEIYYLILWLKNLNLLDYYYLNIESVKEFLMSGWMCDYRLFNL